VLCPGFVRTESVRGIPATAAFRQGFLLLRPDQVARRALADLRAGRTVFRARCRVPRRVDLARPAPAVLRLGARLAGKDRRRGGATPVAQPRIPAPRSEADAVKRPVRS
jgi:hypothetical protein